METLGIIVLVFLAVGPFVIAARSGPKRFLLEEPPFKLEGGVITAYPTCYHCGWQGALDVTEFVKAAAALKVITIMKSPPCRHCGQRWKINLTTISQKYRTGTLV